MAADFPPMRRRLRWMLEGRYRWGYSTFSTGRYGNQSLSVHIYPPDTPRIFRRCAHLARMWLPISMVSTLATASIIVAMIEVSLLTASAGPAALLLLAWIALVRVSAPINDQRVIAAAWKSTITPNLDDELRFAQLNAVLDRLHQAELLRDAGEISPREYRDRWSTAFTQL